VSLLDAVDALTKPTYENHPQYGDDGKYIRTHTVEHPPLLQQLANAVNPSTNADGGSQSSASARNPIDADALYEYAKVCAEIWSWCHIVKIIRSKDAIVDLRRWYVVFVQNPDANHDWYENHLRQVAARIRSRLDPPKRIEITVPCPVCGKRTWTDPDGQELLFPIVVEYKRPQDGGSIKPTALCRACQNAWVGYDAVEELAEEVNEQHAVNE
jgi:hypothetical protein